MDVNHASTFDSKTNQLLCRGKFNLANLKDQENLFKKIDWPKRGAVTINGADIQSLDSAGAWMMARWQQKLKSKNLTISFQDFSKQHQKLLSLVQQKIEEEAPIPKRTHLFWVAQLGQYTLLQYHELLSFLSFLGYLTFEFFRIFRHPKHMRINSVATIIDQSGYQALPIIGLLSFLIGVVIAYQMGLQLRNYGANIYVVDLLGISILREFGPLLTAIMVAGRTGSSFTAQLGMMKINQEIDALNTMGVTPAELLVLPRIIGVFIALPLLTIWADAFGIFGGMVMSTNMLDISLNDFIQRFPRVIKLKTLLLGLGKTPVFALIIASIACFEGFQVKDTANSVGKNTTRSVVLAIFFIIVVDAVFSIIYSKLKL